MRWAWAEVLWTELKFILQVSHVLLYSVVRLSLVRWIDVHESKILITTFPQMIVCGTVISRDAQLNVFAIAKFNWDFCLFLRKTYNTHMLLCKRTYDRIAVFTSNLESTETDPGFVCRTSLIACLWSCGWTVVCKESLFVDKVLFSSFLPRTHYFRSDNRI